MAEITGTTGESRNGKETQGQRCFGGDPQGLTILKVLEGEVTPDELQAPWSYDPATGQLYYSYSEEERVAYMEALEASRRDPLTPAVQAIFDRHFSEQVANLSVTQVVAEEDSV